MRIVFLLRLFELRLVFLDQGEVRSIQLVRRWLIEIRQQLLLTVDLGLVQLSLLRTEIGLLELCFGFRDTLLRACCCFLDGVLGKALLISSLASAPLLRLLRFPLCLLPSAFGLFCPLCPCR